MTENPKDVEEYFENSKCKICGAVVQPHFQGNTKLPKEEHLAKEHKAKYKAYLQALKNKVKAEDDKKEEETLDLLRNAEEERLSYSTKLQDEEAEKIRQKGERV